MDKGKIKNIIILVLLTVNLFFAALMLVNGAESRSYAAAAESSLTAALKSGGITISDSELLSQKSVPACTFSRDKDRERRQVSSVLGSAEPSDLGGNIIMYYGKNGQACFRGTGDFEILMENSAVSVGTDPVKTAERLMEKFGVGLESGANAQYAKTGGSCEVTALCSYKDRPIVNCSVSMTFSKDSLLLVTGVKPMSKITESGSVQVIDTATAVMRLLDVLKNSGYVCREITGVSHCYKLDASASGDGTLTPLWHFSTDIGDFYINGVTGKEETVTQNN